MSRATTWTVQAERSVGLEADSGVQCGQYRPEAGLRVLTQRHRAESGARWPNQLRAGAGGLAGGEHPSERAAPGKFTSVFFLQN